MEDKVKKSLKIVAAVILLCLIVFMAINGNSSKEEIAFPVVKEDQVDSIGVVIPVDSL